MKKNKLKFFSRLSKIETSTSETKEKIEVTKKAKLAILAGFETEIKNGREVPKDSNFSLWLNVAKSIL